MREWPWFCPSCSGSGWPCGRAERPRNTRRLPTLTMSSDLLRNLSAGAHSNKPPDLHCRARLLASQPIFPTPGCSTILPALGSGSFAKSLHPLRTLLSVSIHFQAIAEASTHWPALQHACCPLHDTAPLPRRQLPSTSTSPIHAQHHTQDKTACESGPKINPLPFFF